MSGNFNEILLWDMLRKRFFCFVLFLNRRTFGTCFPQIWTIQISLKQQNTFIKSKHYNDQHSQQLIDFSWPCHLIHVIILLLWQLGPVHPGVHVQEYPLPWSVQVPPFWHGLLAHSSIPINGRKQYNVESVQLSTCWYGDTKAYTRPVYLPNGPGLPEGNY